MFWQTVSEKKGIYKNVYHRKKFRIPQTYPSKLCLRVGTRASLRLEEGVSDTTAKENEVLGGGHEKLERGVSLFS